MNAAPATFSLTQPQTFEITQVHFNVVVQGRCIGCARDGVGRGPPLAKKTGLTHAMQGSPEAIEDHGFVVDKQQAFRHQCSFEESESRMGKVMKNVVPWPIWVSNQILPPCFLTTTV